MERVTLEEALLRIRKEVRESGRTEEIPFPLWGGRILAEDIRAAFDQPPFVRSAMDGYAVRAEETKGASREHPVRLLVTGELSAGDAPFPLIQKGTAIRIMTGAPVPEGADCVIRQEDTDEGGEWVSVYRAYEERQFLCSRGEDFRAGELLAAAGTVIGAAEAGLAAAAGFASLRVKKKPAVLLLTTGNELIEPGSGFAGRRDGKIYNGNAALLYTRLAELKAAPYLVKTLPDDAKEIAACIREEVKRADCIITTGGVSVGRKDAVAPALSMAGARVVFHGVAVRPGGPVLFAMCGDTPVLSLSGNPAGASVMLELLGRELLSALTGQDSRMKSCIALAAGPYEKASPQRRMVYAVYEDGKVRPADVPGYSGAVRTMQGCNCMMDLEAGRGPVREDDKVRVVLL